MMTEERLQYKGAWLRPTHRIVRIERSNAGSGDRLHRAMEGARCLVPDPTEGERALLLTEEREQPGRLQGVYTSQVLHVKRDRRGLTIETRNSVYYLERLNRGLFS